MGLLAVSSGWLPPLLGRVLVVGGIGYVLSVFVNYAFPEADVVTQLLQVPSIIGEFWIMAYLVIVGSRDRRWPYREVTA